MISGPVLVHYHIFKNAGTSVDFALRHSFGARCGTFEGRHAHDVQTSEALSRFLERRPDLCAVSSHLARPSQQFSGCRPIVFLRNPLLRVRSVHNFIRRDPEQHGCPADEMATLARYVRWALGAGRCEGGVTIRNYQVVHLSAASFRTHILKADAQPPDLREAQSLIESWGIVGIVEDYRASAQRFQSRYAGEFPELDFLDVWINRTSGEDLDADSQMEALREVLGTELFERLADANRLDLELYEWAVRRFSSRKAGATADGEAEGPVELAASAEKRTIEKLRDEVRELAAKQDAFVREHSDVIAHRDDILRTREREIAAHEAYARGCEEATAHRDELLRVLDRERAAHDEFARGHAEVAAHRDELLRVLDRERAEHAAFARRYEEALAGHNALARRRDDEISAREALQRAYDDLIAESAALAQDRDRAVAERNALLASRSWRLTAPLRRVRGLFTHGT